MGNGVTVSNTASVSQQQIIDSLTVKLEKANERVKELEAQTFDVIAAQSIEQAYQIASSFPKDKAILEALSAVKEGATNRLNKFATEKKIDGVQLVIDALASKGMLDTLISFVINSVVEQLRKEQEHG
jgi:hypothetical protein|tara:strand:- start:45134 stop:45517 length:384 start_codon:yes stop_codon:yes gene_type:complete